MTLYGFSRKDVTRQLSDFAKKDLISGYPTEEVLQHGLGEFQQGRQTAADMELYAFISAEGIPAAVPTVDAGGSVRMQAAVSPQRCKIYKPYPRSRQGDVADNQEVDVEVIQTGKGAAEGLNYGDAAYYVYNTFPQAIPANTISFCAVFGGVLFAIDKPPQKRVRFRLKTSFNDQGVATAYVLDQFGDAGLSYMDTIEVCDPRKLFAHAIGATAIFFTQGEVSVMRSGHQKYKTNILIAELTAFTHRRFATVDMKSSNALRLQTKCGLKLTRNLELRRLLVS